MHITAHGFVVCCFTSLMLTACAARPQIIQLQVPPAPAVANAAPSLAPVPLPRFNVASVARLEVVPNCADLSMTIANEATKSSQAATKVLAGQVALVAGLDKLGVARSDIKLSGVQITQAFETDSKGKITSRKFRAEVHVTVTTKDFSKISDIMDAGATAGVTTMSSAFRHDKLDELKVQVRDMALKAARAKATQMASGLGFIVGRVVGVRENPNGYLWSNGYFPNASGPQALAAMADEGVIGIGVETQELTVNVEVDFEIGVAS